MKIFHICFICFLLGTIAFGQNKIPTPNEFLPHRLGEHFTPHHLLVDYFEAVADASPQVTLIRYGQTNQDRPLMMVVVSSEENIRDIENIRLQHLGATGLAKAENKTSNDKAIVWLSFGVHGNEAGASESSLATLYALANPADRQVQQWLENTIVIIDPCLNPDGYSRYTHWNRNMGMAPANPLLEAREHREPWPGGRVNHYLFDLNRDWAWQTQVESQQRMTVYNQWMPHVHVDFHEQGYNSPYYFAPAAHPYHDYITDWQAEFQKEIGKNNAKHFDKEGWLYFTGEIFDLFYPSYGDTWPTFNGAVGMTYEQAGHSTAGRAIIQANGDTLKLDDRIAHHLTTALSTVEVSAQSANRLIDRFQNYFAQSPPGTYKSFVVKGDNPSGKIQALCKLLDANGIHYGLADKTARMPNAYDYRTGKTTDVALEKNDLVIDTRQPKAVLVQVLFEPDPFLEDSLTYDITAWAIPYAHGLEAYALKQNLDMGKTWSAPSLDYPTTTTPPYAWIVPRESMDNLRFLGALLQNGVKVRYATGGFSVEDRYYPAGTVIINRGDNRHFDGDLATAIRDLAKTHGQELQTASTGFIEKGRDFGSGGYRLIRAPKVLLLSGDRTSANGFGQVWYYFEQVLGYPVTIIESDQLNADLLDEYNLLILPEGWYQMGDSRLKDIRRWIGKGNRLIAVGSALRVLDGKEGFNLQQYASEKDKSDAKKEDEEAVLEKRLDPYAGQERRRVSRQMPGAIFRVTIDETHPLGYGLGPQYFSLKTSSRSYQLLKNTWNVGSIDEEPFYLGFAGAEAVEKLKGTTVFGVQDMGRGSVVYMVDNPLFRGFWEAGAFLFGNAVFLW